MKQSYYYAATDCHCTDPFTFPANQHTALYKSIVKCNRKRKHVNNCDFVEVAVFGYFFLPNALNPIQVPFKAAYASSNHRQFVDDSLDFDNLTR